NWTFTNGWYAPGLMDSLAIRRYEPADQDAVWNLHNLVLQRVVPLTLVNRELGAALKRRDRFGQRDPLRQVFPEQFEPHRIEHAYPERRRERRALGCCERRHFFIAVDEVVVRRPPRPDKVRGPVVEMRQVEVDNAAEFAAEVADVA